MIDAYAIRGLWSLILTLPNSHDFGKGPNLGGGVGGYQNPCGNMHLYAILAQRV